MPAEIIPLVGIEKTVSNRVVTSTIRSFLEQSGLDKDTRLKIKSSFDQYNTKGYGSMEDNAIPELRNMKVEYTETVDRSAYDVMATYQGEYRDFFTSDNPEIHMRPVYVDSNMEISIEFKSTSKDRIVTWKNLLATFAARNSTFSIEDITYTYLLPFQLYDLLDVIYSKIKTHKTAYSDFYQWLGAHSDGRMVWGSDLTGTFRDVFIKETQSRVYITWEIPDMETGIKEVENGQYKTDFTLKLTYQKPISIWVKYPVLVCNKLLPEKYVLPVSVIRDTDRRKVDRDRLLSDLYLFENQIQVDMTGRKYIRYPWWDDIEIPKYHHDYIPIASILCSITDSDKRSLLNLQDLDLLTLNEEVTTWLLAGGYQHITHSYESPIYIKLLEDNRYVEDSILEVSADLDISSTSDLEICRTYRIIVFAIRNPCLIGSYHRSLIEKNNPNLVELYNANAYLSRDRSQEGRIYNEVEYIPKSTFDCSSMAAKTVQIFSIFSYRIEDSE